MDECPPHDPKVSPAGFVVSLRKMVWLSRASQRAYEDPRSECPSNGGWFA